MPLTGNKGEWSEIYVLFKLLGEQVLHAGDHQLEKLEKFSQPLLQILRTENDESLEFKINSTTREVTLFIGGKEEQSAFASLFQEQATVLFNIIKTHAKTFASPLSEEFMRSWHCHKLKASSHDKADITAVIYDPPTFSQYRLGYSIKSQLGSPSTLLNASQATGLIFDIVGVGLDSKIIKEINHLEGPSKIRERLQKLTDLGYQLKFRATVNSIFEHNLSIIDSKLPELYASMVQFYYSSSDSSLRALTQSLADSNLLNCKIADRFGFYAYKIKKFLCDIALGMMPATEWLGQYDNTNGYLVVKQDGDILSYHIFQRNIFEDYLFFQTKFDTPSATKHKFGVIEKAAQGYQMILNAQIRFIK